MKPLTLFLPLAAIFNVHAQTQAPAPASPQPGQILVTGTVADEASKAAVLARLRELYGAERVACSIVCFCFSILVDQM